MKVALRAASRARRIGCLRIGFLRGLLRRSGRPPPAGEAYERGQRQEADEQQSRHHDDD